MRHAAIHGEVPALIVIDVTDLMGLIHNNSFGVATERIVGSLKVKYCKHDSGCVWEGE